MAVFEIQVRNDLSFWTTDVDLDGITYRLDFHYNSRDDAWYLDIRDLEDNPLRMGLRLVSDVPLLFNWSDSPPEKPEGELIVVTQGELTAPATQEQLGQEAILTYLGDS